MECYIKSMYLCVNDMDRAIHFYEDFFEQEVLIRDEVYRKWVRNIFSEVIVCQV